MQCRLHRAYFFFFMANAFLQNLVYFLWTIMYSYTYFSRFLYDSQSMWTQLGLTAVFTETKNLLINQKVCLLFLNTNNLMVW